MCDKTITQIQAVGRWLQGEVVYRFARCKKPLAMRMMNSCGLPLPDSHIDVLEPRLRWEQLKVWILLPLPGVTSQESHCIEHSNFADLFDLEWLMQCASAKLS